MYSCIYQTQDNVLRICLFSRIWTISFIQRPRLEEFFHLSRYREPEHRVITLNPEKPFGGCRYVTPGSREKIFFIFLLRRPGRFYRMESGGTGREHHCGGANGRQRLVRNCTDPLASGPGFF